MRPFACLLLLLIGFGGYAYARGYLLLPRSSWGPSGFVDGAEDRPHGDPDNPDRAHGVLGAWLRAFHL
jgi:hypothetical protein